MTGTCLIPNLSQHTLTQNNLYNQLQGMCITNPWYTDRMSQLSLSNDRCIHSYPANPYPIPRLIFVIKHEKIKNRLFIFNSKELGQLYVTMIQLKRFTKGKIQESGCVPVAMSLSRFTRCLSPP